MDTTAAQWPPQEIVVKAMEEKVERKIRPQREKVLNCPRCNSTNTKFCYYNNYSLSQPRYFCKSCRRYWTEGGSLRNIPVGGGSRKNKRPPSSSTSSLSLSSSFNKLPDLVPPPPPQNPSKIPDAQDLDLGFALHHHHHRIADMIHLPPFDGAAAATTGGLSLGSFMPPLPPEFKPFSLSFSLDGLGSGYGSFQGVGESINGKLLFPFEDLKVSNTNNNNNARDQSGDHNANGYWNGVIGGGGSW